MIRIAQALALLLVASSPAAAIDTPARAAIVVDLTSGAVLMEKNADTPLPPASMSKLMTLNMVFEALAEGRLSMDDRFPVSERAWRKGGSKMFVRVGDRIRVEDLILGVTVQSGNDACIVLAEGLAGTEEAFADQMNQRAAEIGLDNAHFVNATGWPDPGHEMSVRDLATLAERIITEFPDYFRFFSTMEFTWEDITQKNRNPLLYLDIGADGMKTGHTEASGYGLTATAERDGRRIVAVMNGLESARQRAVEAEKLLNWAYRDFRTGLLYGAGETVAEAEVWIGAQDRVALTPAEDLHVTVPFAAADRMTARLRYDQPIPAPITAGQTVAELIVEAPDMEPMTFPLVAAAAVPEGGVLARVEAGARLLLAEIWPFEGAAGLLE
jgi:D-alanyl-D-alanine carboxypeptidase (penicillin-binding protein 5/6)